MTLGELIEILDQREAVAKTKQNLSSPKEYMNVSECADLTGYSPEYIRQLVFKRKIPFHKRPDRKPLRFRRSDVIEWMAGKKYSPINDLVDEYISKSAGR